MRRAVRSTEGFTDRGDPGHRDSRGGYAGERPALLTGRLNGCWQPVSGLTRTIAALAGAVAGVTGLLSALVAAGIIHGATAPSATTAGTSPAPFVVYAAEGLRLGLGQCFNLDTGQARCGEEDLGLPQRQVGLLAVSNGAEVSVLGVRSLADYNALSAARLQSLDYSDARTIPLEAGLLLAVRTHSGNYAKVWVSIVQTPDFTLKITNYRAG